MSTINLTKPSIFFRYTLSEIALIYEVPESEIYEFLKNKKDWKDQDIFNCLRCNDEEVRNLGMTIFMKMVRDPEDKIFRRERVSESDKDDIRQNSYLAIFQIINKEGWDLVKGTLKAYYVSVLRYSVIKFKTRQRILSGLDDLEDVLEDSGPNKQDIFMETEELERFRFNFSQLSPILQKALQMRYYDGKSYEEIRIHFKHTSQVVSRSLVSRAIKKLRVICEQNSPYN